MTYIPQSLRDRIKPPKGEVDPDIVQWDIELENHLAKYSNGSLSKLHRVGTSVRKAALRLPPELTPRKLVGLGVVLGTLATNPHTGRASKAVGLAGSAASIWLAVEQKDIQETEERVGGLRLIEDKPRELTTSSHLYRVAAGLAGLGTLGDSLGLDSKRRVVAFAGGAVAAIAATCMSHMEIVDKSALEAARMGGE